MNLLAVKRLWNTLRYDVVLQIRNGFYAAVGFILFIWVVILAQFKEANLSSIVAGLLLGNLEITTFYFMAGMVMLEKGEGTLEAQVVSPLRSREYLASKVISVSLLSVIENLIIAMVLSHLQFSPLPVLIGVFFASALFALCGFMAVVRYDSINEFLLPSMLFTTLLTIPLIDFFGLVKSPLFYLHPLQAPLTLMQAGFAPLETWQWVYGIGYSLLWVALSGWAATRVYKRFIVTRQGN